MKNLKVVTIPVTALQQNCSLLVDEERSSAVIVDPGGDVKRIAEVVDALGLTVGAVWLTHSHFDHCGGVADCLARWPGIELLGHPGESYFRAKAAEAAALWNLSGFAACPEPSRMISGTETLTVGGQAGEWQAGEWQAGEWQAGEWHECKVLFVPGHSPGHVAFYFAAQKILIAGDTLFQGSIGRTDLPGGNHQQLLSSIKQEILSLPDDVLVYPGHGPCTSVGQERRSNPYLVN